VAVNLIVLAVTLLMAAFGGVWIFLPRLRAWMEMPKHRFLESQRQFPSVLRNRQSGREKPSQPDSAGSESSPNTRVRGR
jgi:hypothetical protein